MEENISSPVSTEPIGEKKKNIWPIAVLVVIIFILTGALAYVLLVKKVEAPAPIPQSSIPTPEKKGPAEKDLDAANQAKPIESPAQAAIEQKKKEDEEKYAGWMTYKSDKYKYQIKYPSGTTIGETMQNDIGMSPDSGMTFEEAYAKVTSQVCVEFKTKKGTLYVSAPINKGYAYAICGRTGIGANTIITKSSEKIMIDGKEYAIDVKELVDPDGKSIEAEVELEDKTQIYFSADDYAGWAEIKKMVESWKKIK